MGLAKVLFTDSCVHWQTIKTWNIHAAYSQQNQNFIRPSRESIENALKCFLCLKQTVH